MRKRRILISTFVVVAILAAIAFLAWPKAPPTFTLADGTTAAIESISRGTNYHFYQGTRSEHLLFKLIGPEAPGKGGKTGIHKYTGSETILPAANPSGGIALAITRSADTPFLSDAWNNVMAVKLVSASGERVEGVKKAISHTLPTTRENEKVLVEQSVWEFPITTEPELHFCIVSRNPSNNSLATNEFMMQNPSER